MDSKALGQFLMQPSTADVLNTPVRRGGILPVTEYPNRSEFDLTSGLTGALWNAITAPARAARGEISEDQQIPEAFNFAGSLTLGSLLAPRPTGSVGMGGRAAKGALDMSEAARMARAKEMGFDTSNPWYRATSGDDSSGSRWFSPTPEYAENFGDAVGKFYLKDGDVLDLTKYDAQKSFFADDFKKALGLEHGDASLDGPLKSLEHPDFGFEAYQALDLPEVRNHLARRYSSVLANQWVDGGGEEAARLILDPAHIRSVNAAFDPAKSSSANILAANAKTGAAVPLATKALEAQQPQGIRAFHGSPHDFDKFSMEHIGKGEGAQAYGHGLYFAEAEDVARSYRENLTRGARTGSGPGRIDVFTVDGVEVPASQKSVADIAHTMREYSIDPNTADGLDWLQREVGARGLPFETIEQAANLYKRDITRNTVDGRMYEVNIKADPEDFLDWDKPLSQQSEKVRAALEAQGFKSDRDAIKSFDDALYAALMDDSTPAVLPKQPPDPLGSDIVRKMHAQRGSQWLDPNKTGEANASQSLREAGIPGIRYLDQMSRGEGKGSSNYVVFDDNLIEILRKYGLLGPVAGGGTLAGMLMGGQEGETY